MPRGPAGRIAAPKSSWGTISRDYSSAELPGSRTECCWPVHLSTTTLYMLSFTCVHTHFLTVSHSQYSQVTSTQSRCWIGMVSSSIYYCTMCLKLTDPHIPNTWNYVLTVTCSSRILPLWWTLSWGWGWPQLVFYQIYFYVSDFQTVWVPLLYCPGVLCFFINYRFIAGMYI